MFFYEGVKRGITGVQCKLILKSTINYFFLENMINIFQFVILYHNINGIVIVYVFKKKTMIRSGTKMAIS